MISSIWLNRAVILRMRSSLLIWSASSYRIINYNHGYFKLLRHFEILHSQPHTLTIHPRGMLTCKSHHHHHHHLLLLMLLLLVRWALYVYKINIAFVNDPDNDTSSFVWWSTYTHLTRQFQCHNADRHCEYYKQSD